MPRYFFHIRGPVSIDDMEGREIGDGVAEARTEALADAREIIAEAALSGLDVLGRRFEIADKLGRTITTVDFREALTPEAPAGSARRPVLRLIHPTPDDEE